MSDICYVYVIGYADGQRRAPEHTYKVGITTSLSARLAQLSTGSPHRVDLDYWIACPNRKFAAAVEEICHQELKIFRANGEWFVAPFALVRRAVQAAWRLVEIRAFSSAQEAHDAGLDWRGFIPLTRSEGADNLDFEFMKGEAPESIAPILDVMREIA